MARSEPSTINHCVAPSVTSRASSLTKDQLQRTDEIKTEFLSREGIYKISSLIDNLGKLNTNTCLSEPVKITLLTRLQAAPSDAISPASSRRSSATTNDQPSEQPQQRPSLSNGNALLTDVLAFNVGRELIVYEYADATQVNHTLIHGRGPVILHSSRISVNRSIIGSTNKTINPHAMI